MAGTMTPKEEEELWLAQAEARYLATLAKSKAKRRDTSAKRQAKRRNTSASQATSSSRATPSEPRGTATRGSCRERQDTKINERTQATALSQPTTRLRRSSRNTSVVDTSAPLPTPKRQRRLSIDIIPVTIRHRDSHPNIEPPGTSTGTEPLTVQTTPIGLLEPPTVTQIEQPQNTSHTSIATSPQQEVALSSTPRRVPITDVGTVIEIPHSPILSYNTQNNHIEGTNTPLSPEPHRTTMSSQGGDNPSPTPSNVENADPPEDTRPFITVSARRNTRSGNTSSTSEATESNPSPMDTNPTPTDITPAREAPAPNLDFLNQSLARATISPPRNTTAPSYARATSSPFQAKKQELLDTLQEIRVAMHQAAKSTHHKIYAQTCLEKRITPNWLKMEEPRLINETPEIREELKTIYSSFKRDMLSVCERHYRNLSASETEKIRGLYIKCQNLALSTGLSTEEQTQLLKTLQEEYKRHETDATRYRDRLSDKRLEKLEPPSRKRPRTESPYSSEPNQPGTSRDSDLQALREQLARLERNMEPRADSRDNRGTRPQSNYYGRPQRGRGRGRGKGRRDWA